MISEKTKAYKKRYYLEHKEEIKRKKREYYLKNREKVLSKNKQWKEENNYVANTPYEYFAKYKKEHKQQINARNLAEKNTIIPTAMKCEYCNDNDAIERHHNNYEAPLEVELVCRECHLDVHKVIRGD